MKKVVSLLIVLVMIAAAIPAMAGGGSFRDVSPLDWSCEYIDYAVGHGYLKGVGGGYFDPQGTTTRAMVVTVLWRMEGSPDTAYRADFKDVPANEWYSVPVIWAKDAGVVLGVSATSFDPDGVITREQLATMFYRYSGFKGYGVTGRADLDGFKDKKSVSDWAGTALSWAVCSGLVKGVTETTVEPGSNATREQLAAILQRFDTYREKAPTVIKGETKGMPYAVLYPDGFKAGEKYPLLVFLHGSGSVGAGIDEYLTSNSFFTEIAKLDVSEYPFITLTPNLDDMSGWISYYKTLIGMINDIASTPEVDESRVYLMGTSLGGYGTWFLAAKYPERFAAAVPISGGGEASLGAKLVDVPIWAFHGELDEAVPYEDSVNIVNAIKEAGGTDAKLTTFWGVGHGNWDQVYSDPEVYAWMLLHSKPQG